MSLKAIIRIFIYGTAALIAAYFLFAYVVQYHIHSDPSYERSEAGTKASRQTNQLLSFGSSVRRGVIRLLLVDESNVNKLNFEYHKERLSGSLNIAVFSEQGGNVTYLESDFINSIAPDSDFIFTLGNKISNTGTDRTELLMILPNIKKDLCNKLNKNHARITNKKLTINTDPYPLEIKDNIIELPFQSFGCIKTSNGNYFYQVILER